MIKWKKVRVWRPKPRVDSITPSWLRVERAMIFFRSDSIIAARPAINIVREAMRRSEGWNRGWADREGKNR